MREREDTIKLKIASDLDAYREHKKVKELQEQIQEDILCLLDRFDKEELSGIENLRDQLCGVVCDYFFDVYGI